MLSKVKLIKFKGRICKFFNLNPQKGLGLKKVFYRAVFEIIQFLCILAHINDDLSHSLLWVLG